jgi:hypothetical protein
MPFRSQAQARLCWLLKRKGKNKSWDCEEWARKSKKKLPYKVKSKGRSKTKKSHRRR